MSARVTHGYSQEELDIAYSCSSMSGVASGRSLQSRPPKLLFNMHPDASDEEVLAVVARLEALDHVEDIVVNRI